jgi:glycosyltransferase involved in cell wall biosynthesis
MSGHAGSERRLQVAVDATPLIGDRTGVGTYVENLLGQLDGHHDLDLRLMAFTIRGRRELTGGAGRSRIVHRPVPARLLHRAWLRGDVPSAEWLAGRVDVVHGTNFVLPPPRSAAGVLTVHDLSFVRYPQHVNAASLAYRTLVPRGIARAARVFTPTRAVAEELIDAYRLSEDRVLVTPLGVDAAWFEAGAEPRLVGLPDDYLLAVGTLEPRKGLDVLLEAYRMVLAADPDVPPLVLVGPPGWGPALDTAGLPTDRVLLPGFVPTQVLRGVVARARLLVFPSRYEGFGLPPLEALAAGTAVVASDIDAVREVLGGHGRLTPPGDATALAGAIDDELRATRAPAEIAAAREHAATFTWRRCADLTASAYSEAAQ